MKLIKNAQIYKIDLPSAKALEQHLTEKRFIDPMELEHGSIGFIMRDGMKYVDQFVGGMAFTVRVDEKIIPVSAVNSEVQKRAEAIFLRNGYHIGRKQRSEIKDEVVFDFRRKALLKTSIITCFYDTSKNHLFVPTTSLTLAGQITALIVRAVGSVKSETIHISALKHGLTTRLLNWLAHDDEAFSSFVPCGEVVLFAAGQKVSIKMDELANASDGLTKALKDGFMVKSLRFWSGNDVGFTLTSDFSFRSIEFPDSAEAGNDEDLWLHEASVQVLNLSRIIDELCTMMSYVEEKEAA